jgi:hypothetical protein
MNWIARWVDWLRSNRRARRVKLIGLPSIRGVYLGQTDEVGPVLWCAESIVVECIVSTTTDVSQAREFTLKMDDGSIVVANAMVRSPLEDTAKIAFHYAVPERSSRATIAWKGNSIGDVQIDLVAKSDFRAGLRLDAIACYIRMGRQWVAATTWVEGQVRCIEPVARFTSRFGFLPLNDHPVSVVVAGQTKAIPIPQVGNSIGATAGRFAIPTKDGRYCVAWSWDGVDFQRDFVDVVTRMEFRKSLEVVAQRFAVEDNDRKRRFFARLPSSGFVAAAPCFVLRSRLKNAVGRMRFTIAAIQSGREIEPVEIRVVLAGVTPIFGPAITATKLRQTTAFVLRLGRRKLATIAVGTVPVARIDGEGGFEPPADFTWTQAMEEEFLSRMSSLES